MKRVLKDMINKLQSKGSRPAMVALWIGAGACAALAQSSAPAFPSPADATQGLFQAVQSNDEQAIAKILGAATELTSSRDSGADKVERERFVEKYQQMHRLRHEADGTLTLYIGAENWPFPIPLVKDNDAWRFDSDAGQKEVLYRRIGENELIAIMTCHEFVAAEKGYQASSDPTDPRTISPTSLAAKAATGSDTGGPLLLNGYYFRLLPKGKMPGQFALIAYPAEYRSSGVMTFVVMKNDVIYEKDLGPNTAAQAGATAAFHKDASWRRANE